MNNKLSFWKLFIINATAVIITMIAADRYFGGVGYAVSAHVIVIVKKLFLVQLAINLALLIWYFKFDYNRQLMILNIIVLVVFWLVAFLFFFVSVN